MKKEEMGDYLGTETTARSRTKEAGGGGCCENVKRQTKKSMREE